MRDAKNNISIIVCFGLMIAVARRRSLHGGYKGVPRLFPPRHAVVELHSMLSICFLVRHLYLEMSMLKTWIAALQPYGSSSPFAREEICDGI